MDLSYVHRVGKVYFKEVRVREVSPSKLLSHPPNSLFETK